MSRDGKPYLSFPFPLYVTQKTISCSQFNKQTINCNIHNNFENY